MNRQEVLDRLNELALDKGAYWLITGGAMVLYGLRDQTGDIDLGCTTALFEALQAQGCPVSMMPDGTRRVELAPDVELFENWLQGDIVEVEGVPVVSLEGLIAMKRQIGREKDMRDIALIEEYLAKGGC